MLCLFTIAYFIVCLCLFKVCLCNCIIVRERERERERKREGIYTVNACPVSYVVFCKFHKV